MRVALCYTVDEQLGRNPMNRNRTFCASECSTKECPRHQDNAPKDTNGLPVPKDTNGQPVLWGHFRATCPDYRRPRTRST